MACVPQQLLHATNAKTSEFPLSRGDRRGPLDGCVSSVAHEQNEGPLFSSHKRRQLVRQRSYLASVKGLTSREGSQSTWCVENGDGEDMPGRGRNRLPERRNTLALCCYRWSEYQAAGYKLGLHGNNQGHQGGQVERVKQSCSQLVPRKTTDSSKRC